jgi:hypothetical protein
MFLNKNVNLPLNSFQINQNNKIFSTETHFQTMFLAVDCEKSLFANVPNNRHRRFTLLDTFKWSDFDANAIFYFYLLGVLVVCLHQ